MKRIAWVVCIGIVLLGLPVRADNTADEADVAFTLGNQAYTKKDYDTALAWYLLSHRLVPNRNVLFNIARCFEQLSKFDEAFRYYFELSSEKLADDDARDVRAALARLSPKVALLSLTSEPDGADVYVDREDLGSRGRTPLTLALTPGAHLAKVKLAGFRNAEARVHLVRSREAKSKLTLERILGQVEVTGTPEGASVRENTEGPELSKLPAKLSFIPGQKLLVVTAKGFTPQQLLVDVKPEGLEQLKVALIELPQPTGKVVVTANRDPALVRVDGKESGFTPTVLSLPVGEHTIEVSISDLSLFNAKVNVGKDTEDKVAAELRYVPPPVRAASKTLLSVDDAPASVTVISREELQSFGYQTLAEAVQAVRGIFLSNDRIYTYIGVRGFSPPGDLNTRIAILWDGHVMNDVWAGQGFSARDLDVDLNEIERIEVIRGPGSTLYGTGAIFAVINLVPRDHLGERHVEATVAAGGEGGVGAHAAGSFQSDRGSVLASVAGFQSSGAPVTDVPTRGVALGIDGERSLGATVRAKAAGFTLSAKVNQRRKEIPTNPGGSTFGLPGTKYVDARGFAELRFDHEFSRLSISARASYDGSRFRGVNANDESGTLAYDSDTGGGDWLGLELRTRIRLFSGTPVGDNHLSVGFEGQLAQIFMQSDQKIALGKPPFTHQRLLLSGYALDEWKLHPRLFITAGLRVDKYLDLDSISLSPRLGIVGRPYAKGLTKLVVGQSFRAPNVYELYFEDDLVTQRRAGPLKQETITTFEAEHSHDLTPELRITLAGYFNLINQLVVLKDDAPPMMKDCGTALDPVFCTQFQNSPVQIRAIGAEAQVHWQPGRYTMIDATYSFVILDGPTGDPTLTGIRRATPMHLASLKAMVPLYENALRVSGQLTYQSPRGGGLGTGTLYPSVPGGGVGEALLLNFGLSGEYGHVRYFAGVQNLLDSAYLLPIASEAGTVAVPQYGRTFLLQVAASF